MFVYSERAEDIIAHFIGQFEIRLEETRMRLDYADFAYRARENEDAGPPPTLPADADQFHRIKYYEPGVEHTPQFWHPSGEAPFGYAPLMRPHAIPPRLEAEHDLPIEQFDIPPFPAGWAQGSWVGFLPAPGEVILVLNQQISLIDNDVLDLGDGPLPLFDPALEARLADLLVEAHSVAPALTDAPMPKSVDTLPDYVADMSQDVETLAEDGEHVVASGETISGAYVDGAETGAPPKLEDVLPAPFKPEEPLEESEAATAGETSDGPDESLPLEAGANLLNNSAVLNNAGLMGGVVAVTGDVHRIDAVVQVNAMSDADAGLGPGAPSEAYNIAMFSQILPEAQDPVPVDTAITPQGWHISIVQGDLVFLQWVSQVSFVYDNDIHLLAATGAESNITTGGNLDQNILTFADLGAYYDLILVGGALYDVNMILQTNVLLDDDTGWGSGAGTGGGNLLYNEASLTNVGTQNWLEGLPEHYHEAMDGLANGNLGMPGGFGDDAAFAGLAGLRVLFVTGDIYDLSYIKQMNVLGDADQLGLAEAALLDPEATDDWQISTGANALVNTAAILDVDVMGDTAYLGGEEYSDAILIQAEILLAGPDKADDPDALANEVIAFLDTEDCTPPPDDGMDAPMIDTGASLDAMQSVLA